MLPHAMAKSYQSSILQLVWSTIVEFMVLNVLRVLFAIRLQTLPNVALKVEKTWKFLFNLGTLKHKSVTFLLTKTQTFVCTCIDSFTPGRRTGSSFFQILYQQSQQNMVLLSFVDIQKIWIFTKFGGCSSKIEPAMPILILKFKRAWQTQFFSHTLQILVNDRFFIGH